MSNKWENLKDKANDAFKKKDYKAALSLYSDSISKNYILFIYRTRSSSRFHLLKPRFMFLHHR